MQSAAAPKSNAITGRAVSVVIPTHNRLSLLKRTLRCVLSQRGADVEVIVVNDGSVDATSSFLRSLIDERVIAMDLPEAGGVVRARNLGLDRASFPWVAFLDDDDLWGPARLSHQLDALRDSGAGWACSDAVLVGRGLNVLGVQPAPTGGQVLREVLQRNIIPGGASAVLASTELVRDVGGFDASCDAVADWDLWTRLACAAPLIGVAHPDVGYYLHAGSMSTDVARMTRGWQGLGDKYATLRTTTGVELDGAWWQSYLLGLHLSSGNRRAAVRAKAHLSPGSGLTRAAGALAMLAAPKAVVRRQRMRDLRAYDPALTVEAVSWLEALATSNSAQATAQ